jgi:hypothetical protein
MPFPKEGGEELFSICCSNSELGSMGAGYPLFFELIKHIGILMLILTIIFFLPSSFMMYKSLSLIKDKM